MDVPEFHTQHVFVTDDDDDDRLLFQEVVKELPYLIHLSMARDGDETIKSLKQFQQLPDIQMCALTIRLVNCRRVRRS